MNKKEKTYIIFREAVLVFLEIGAFWVLGMSLVLLTNLYVVSELPKTGFWAILWLAGCIEICFMSLEYKPRRLRLSETKRTGEGK
jgi:hypothetical protein